jgi:D-glycero-alpha-D-manno-heptose-7-phosphate kinase
LIITRTPLRVCLFGGGCDHKEFYSEFGCLLIGFGINQYVYITCRKTPQILPFKSRLQYSSLEIVNDNKDIKHPAIRGALEFLGIDYGIELTHLIDVPARTGTGSSSSFMVGLLNTLCHLRNENINKYVLAKNAIHVERELLDEPGGIQDQIWAAHSGVGTITVEKSGDYSIRPLPVCDDFLSSLKSSMVIFYTGLQQRSFEAAKTYKKKSSFNHLQEILKISREAKFAFYHEKLEHVGQLLDHTWQAKRSVSELISNKDIDDLYDTGKRYGAWGGKILGAGGRGFMLFMCEDPQKLKDHINLPIVNFDFDFEGSVRIL